MESYHFRGKDRHPLRGKDPDLMTNSLRL